MYKIMVNLSKLNTESSLLQGKLLVLVDKIMANLSKLSSLLQSKLLVPVEIVEVTGTCVIF